LKDYIKLQFAAFVRYHIAYWDRDVKCVTFLAVLALSLIHLSHAHPLFSFGKMIMDCFLY